MVLSLVDLMMRAFLAVIPNTILLGIIAVLIFAVAMTLGKVRASGSMQLAFLLILGFAGAIGGVFQIISFGMTAVAGGVFFLGVWKLIGQR